MRHNRLDGAGTTLGRPRVGAVHHAVMNWSVGQSCQTVNWSSGRPLQLAATGHNPSVALVAVSRDLACVGLLTNVLPSSGGAANQVATQRMKRLRESSKDGRGAPRHE
jgi:hypothetical protein